MDLIGVEAKPGVVRVPTCEAGCLHTSNRLHCEPCLINIQTSLPMKGRSHCTANNHKLDTTLRSEIVCGVSDTNPP